MAAVPRVLLDHVDDDLAELGLVAGRTDQRAEVVVPLVDLAGVRHLGVPGLPRLGDHGVLRDGAVEVEVAVLGRLERPR